MTRAPGGGPACLEAALNLLRESRVPLPIRPGTKKPYIRWKRLTRERVTESMVRKWWARWPRAQVAMLCGQASGVAVLEADGEGAQAMLKGLALPETLTVIATRGPHLHFRCAGPVPSRSPGLADGRKLELKGDGAYVMVPPSVHPSGHIYHVARPEVPPAELPAAVTALFTDTPPLPPPKGKLPDRLRAMLDRGFDRAVALWEGRVVRHDPSGSAKDMLLLWFLRKHRFTAEEAADVLPLVPYPVDGGRTADYVNRSVAKVWRADARPKGQEDREAFGTFPAQVVASGLWAQLSPKAKAVYAVLVVRAMRPSGIVRDGVESLAARVGVHPDSVSLATGELMQVGLIRKKAGATGGMYWVLPMAGAEMTYTEESSAQVKSLSPGADILAASSGAMAGGPRARHTGPPTSSPKAPPQGRGSGREGGPFPKNTIHDQKHLSRGILGIERVDLSRENLGMGVTPGPAAREDIKPSMCLHQEIDRYGRMTWFRVCRSGERVPVWRGRVGDDLGWNPPECLRWEDRRAEWPKVETKL